MRVGLADLPPQPPLPDGVDRGAVRLRVRPRRARRPQRHLRRPLGQHGLRAGGLAPPGHRLEGLPSGRCRSSSSTTTRSWPSCSATSTRPKPRRRASASTTPPGWERGRCCAAAASRRGCWGTPSRGESGGIRPVGAERRRRQRPPRAGCLRAVRISRRRRMARVRAVLKSGRPTADRGMDGIRTIAV